MAKVSLQNVSKFFPGPKKSKVIAVSNLSLEIGDGEFMVFVGPSGCGKTTTLRMIAGLEKIDEGSIYMEDIKVNNLEPKDRDVAMVFQNYALYPHMNVLENMSLGLKLRKFPKAQIKERIEEASHMLGIQDLLQRMPDQLSGGQRQRVAVGRALVRRPKVFLFDEPLSNLDARMRLQMRMELTELHQKLGSTMIYVTHDQAEAMTMGDRIVVMNEGNLQQVDLPVQIYRHPANQFVASFIGSPPMNLLHLNLRQDIDSVSRNQCASSMDLILPEMQDFQNKTISTIGFRPENAQIVGCHDRVDVTKLTMKATIQWLEPTGADTFIHLMTGSYKVIVRESANAKWQIQQRVTIQVSANDLHIF